MSSNRLSHQLATSHSPSKQVPFALSRADFHSASSLGEVPSSLSPSLRLNIATDHLFSAEWQVAKLWRFWHVVMAWSR